MDKKGLKTFLWRKITQIILKINLKNRIKKDSNESFKSILNMMIYASGSKFFRFGPATRPTRPKRTKEPIPKPAAHGLKPPKAKEANKFMILNIISSSQHTDFYEKYTYIETFLRNYQNRLTIPFIKNPQNFYYLFYYRVIGILLAQFKTIKTVFF